MDINNGKDSEITESQIQSNRLIKKEANKTFFKRNIIGTIVVVLLLLYTIISQIPQPEPAKIFVGMIVDLPFFALVGWLIQSIYNLIYRQMNKGKK